MKIKRKHVLVFTPLVTLIVLVIAIDFSTTSFERLAALEDNDWNMERIEEALGVSIPHHAMDLIYEGEWGRLTVLDLSFKALPETITSFAKNFCQGILYQNYDPFNAINVSDQVSSPLVVELSTPFVPFFYYSYSPNAPTTLFGNRCFRIDSEVFKIAVDQSNPELYALQMEYVLSGGVPLPDIKLPNSPILFRGFRLRDGEPRLAYNNFCIDIDPLEFMDDGDGLSGIHVNLSLDDRLLTSAYISETGLLIPSGHNINGLEEASNTYFQSCHDTRYLQSGLHTVTISVDNAQPYSWTFYKR